NLTAQAIGTKQVDVAGQHLVGALDVDLHQRLRSQAAMNHIGREVLHVGRVDVLEAGDLPDVAVVVGELLDNAIADAVSAAVADVADPGPVGTYDQGGAGRAHAVEFAILLAAGVNGGVGLQERLAQRGGGAVLG